MTAVKITASAGYLPEKVVTNDELSQLMDTSDEWIVSHTGIKKRHYAIAENTSDLATKVAQKLLQQAKLDATKIDLIIVSTITPDALTPAPARCPARPGSPSRFCRCAPSSAVPAAPPARPPCPPSPRPRHKSR